MQGQKALQKDKEMAREYHNLQGVVRDMRAAALAASEGDQKAAELCDAAYDALGLLDAFVEGDLDGGQDPDADASGDDSDDESDDGADEQPSERNMERVGAVGRGTTVHSTRARVRAESRPRAARNYAATEVGKPREVAAKPAKPRNGGKR